MKKASIIFLLFVVTHCLYGQVHTSITEYHQEKVQQEEVERKIDFGFGFGLDYGGVIGVKLSLSPFKYIAIFGAVGYHMVDIGWNLGMNIYILPKTNLNKIRPFIKAMYGTNRAIKVEGASEYDKNYAGFTPGAGVEFRFGAKATHGLSLNLNFPISSSEFNDDWETVKNDPNIEVIQDVLPVAFSIGYHIEF